MTIQKTLAVAAFALATLAATSTAQAGILLTAPGLVTQQVTDTDYTINFNGLAGPADLSFVLDGYASLDGENFYQDDFTLSLNNVAILSGTFNLGGGGNNVVFFAPVGSSINNVSGNGTNVTFAGGNVNISTPLNLQAGSNSLKFAYTSLTTGHAGFQGFGDESWGVSDVLVTQTGAVPEPGTWALMIIGFGAAGATLRQSRRRLAVASF